MKTPILNSVAFGEKEIYYVNADDKRYFLLNSLCYALGLLPEYKAGEINTDNVPEKVNIVQVKLGEISQWSAVSEQQVYDWLLGINPVKFMTEAERVLFLDLREDCMDEIWNHFQAA